MKCPECNAKVGDGEKFCGECGAPVPSEEAPPAVPESEITELAAPEPPTEIEIPVADEAVLDEPPPPPEPEYTPPEPEPVYTPPLEVPPEPEYAPPAPPVAPEGKKKTGMIIAIVVVVLLLCCCCCAIAAILGLPWEELLYELSNMSILPALRG